MISLLFSVFLALGLIALFYRLRARARRRARITGHMPAYLDLTPWDLMTGGAFRMPVLVLVGILLAILVGLAVAVFDAYQAIPPAAEARPAGEPQLAQPPGH